MSDNSSVTSLPHDDCFTLGRSTLITGAFSITNVLLILPLSTLTLYLGYQRQKRKRSSTAAESGNPSNAFTYQMAVMEILGCLGCLLYCLGVSVNLPNCVTFSLYVFFATWCVKIHFHTLTCVERYLAVVHPVTYLGLKRKGRTKMRNISIGCVWLLCFMEGIVISQTLLSIIMSLYLVFVFLALIITGFCCISVLVALRRPRPGEVSRGREQGDQMKQRAFITVVSIMASLWLCLGGIVVCIGLEESQMLSFSAGCAVRSAALWFSLPNSLVLPLLYLHRAGKLPRCKRGQ